VLEVGPWGIVETVREISSATLRMGRWRTTAREFGVGSRLG
jgi:hypothetical protein